MFVWYDVKGYLDLEMSVLSSAIFTPSPPPLPKNGKQQTNKETKKIDIFVKKNKRLTPM